MKTLELIRKDLRTITPYSSARDEFDGVGEVFLDANENGLTTAYNRYPDPLQRQLKSVISSVKQIPVSQLCLGNGSDEILDLILRLTCKSFHDSIAYLDPSYGMYSVLAKVNGLNTIAIPLSEQFELDVEAILTRASAAKTLIICNPNNPTGNVFRQSDLLEIITRFNGVVVIDEAYVDFCLEESLAGKVSDLENLIVVQTLSKCYGMAGLRVGMAIANETWIKGLNSIKPPYNISEIVQEEAIRNLEKIDWKEVKTTILSERARIHSFLTENSIIKEVFPSAANFILFRVENANELYTFLTQKGVVVRNRSTQTNCSNTLRVSIGTPEENNRFINALSLYKA